MLEVKRQIQKKVKNIPDDEHLKNQNELKNSIKNLYIDNEKKKKTIDECAQLTTQIREEYAKLQRENNELELAIEKYKNYIEQIQPRARQNFYEKPIRKRKFFKRDFERRYSDKEDESDDSEDYIEVQKKRKKPRKRLIYDDEIDGKASEPEIDSDPSEEKEEINKTPLNKKKTNKKKLRKELRNQ